MRRCRKGTVTVKADTEVNVIQIKKVETDPTAPKPKATAEPVKRKSPGDTLLVPKRIKKDSQTAQISATNATNTGVINLTKKSEPNRAEVEKLRKEKKSVQKVKS